MFRNIVISIPDISEAEKLDKFLNGLKPMIRLEVLKAGCNNMNDAARIALNVYSALYGAGMFQGQNAFIDSGPQPMEIGNLQGIPHYRGKSFKSKNGGNKSAKNSQRAEDIANGTCFVCQKKGCRASNHYDNGSVSNNNSQAENFDSSYEQRGPSKRKPTTQDGPEKSAIKVIRESVVDLVRQVKSLSEYPVEYRVQFNGQYIHDDNEVPIKPLIVLKGKINSQNARMLKDDGCNTNLVSKEFLQRNRRLFKIIRTRTSTQHSMQGSGERASEMILSGKIQIGSHVYTSNFLVGSCRYDVLLGMPWHVANNPEIDYPNCRVLVGNE